MTIPAFHVGVRNKIMELFMVSGKSPKKRVAFWSMSSMVPWMFPLPRLDDPIPPARAQTGRCLLSYLGLSRIAGCGMISLDLMGF